MFCFTENIETDKSHKLIYRDQVNRILSITLNEIDCYFSSTLEKWYKLFRYSKSAFIDLCTIISHSFDVRSLFKWGKRSE